MRFCVVVESNSDRLEVNKLDLERLREILKAKLEVRWNRDGDVRMVPRHVLQNCYNAHRDWKRSRKAGRSVKAPEHAECIKWDQTVDLPQPAKTIHYTKVEETNRA